VNPNSDQYNISINYKITDINMSNVTIFWGIWRDCWKTRLGGK